MIRSIDQGVWAQPTALSGDKAAAPTSRRHGMPATTCSRRWAKDSCPRRGRCACATPTRGSSPPPGWGGALNKRGRRYKCSAWEDIDECLCKHCSPGSAVAAL